MGIFTGVWLDESGVRITIEESGNLLTVTYGNGRVPFSGFSVGLSSPVIDVTFPDVPEQTTGVFSAASKVIYWSNDTQWAQA